MKIHQKKINFLILFLLFISFFFKSINGFLRWDLNQHIGMVDNFFAHGSFYPSTENPYSPVSIYPMGLRLITYVLMYLGIDNSITSILLVIAVLILCFTILLFLCSPLVKIKSDSPIVPLIVSYILICCNFFIFYSTEFKPDTLAYLFCFSGLILYLNNKKTILLSSFLIGSSVIFKQHSVGFIFGLLFYSIYNYRSSLKYLSFLSSIIYISIFILIYSDKTIRFFSFELVSDDVIRPISDIFFDIYNTLSNLLIFTIFFIFT